MEAIMIGFLVGAAVGIAAAIFTSLDVFLALKTAKAAPGRKPGYFNIGYKPEHSTEFCRAHLVGVIDRLENKVLYVVEIHPEDATKARAWAVPEMELRGVYLQEKERLKENKRLDEELKQKIKIETDTFDAEKFQKEAEERFKIFMKNRNKNK